MISFTYVFSLLGHFNDISSDDIRLINREEAKMCMKLFGKNSVRVVLL